jgi:hypothetical protein
MWLAAKPWAALFQCADAVGDDGIERRQHQRQQEGADQRQQVEEEDDEEVGEGQRRQQRRAAAEQLQPGEEPGDAVSGGELPGLHSAFRQAGACRH